MRLLLLFVLSLGAGFSTPMWSQSVTMPLWPANPPGAANVPAGEQEHDTTTAADPAIAGRPVARIGDVSRPTLAFYPAPEAGNSGATVAVFPGGAYRILAYDLEGTEVCQWLNSIGVNCALVKYRVPEAGRFPQHAEDLMDAQRAVRLVRANADRWHLDRRRVGVLGFSAGGHLVAVLNAHFADRVYTPADDADRLSARPDFSLLIYPGYISLEDATRNTEQKNNEEKNSDLKSGELKNGFVLKIRPGTEPIALTPPSFLLQAEDDPVHVENAIVYFEALRQAGVPAEMHLYAQGGHGYGLRPTGLPITHWPELADTWLHTIGILSSQ